MNTEGLLKALVIHACTHPAETVPLETLHAAVHSHIIPGIVHMVNGGKDSRLCIAPDLHMLALEVVARARTPKTVFSLYSLFGEYMATYLQEAAASVRAVCHGPILLQEVGRRWQSHLIVTRWLTPVFRSVDPAYNANYMRVTGKMWREPVFQVAEEGDKWRADNVPAYLTSVSMLQFRVNFFGLVKGRIADIIQQQANLDRQGVAVDRCMLKQAVEMMLVMGICQQPAMAHMRSVRDMEAAISTHGSTCNPEYVADFEKPFVSGTLEYYRPLCMQWLLLPVPVYLQHVRKALEREDDRCRAYVYSFTRRRVIGECRALFLQEHVGDIVGNTSSGMLVMLQVAYNTDEPVDAVSAPKEDLAAMYDLFKGTGKESDVDVEEGFRAMSCVFQEFIITTGARALQLRRNRAAPATAAGKNLPAADPEYVHDIIAVMVRMQWLLLHVFKSNAHLGKGFLRGMERVLAMDENSPEVIATFLDTTLQGKDRQGRIDEETIMANVESGLGLVRYLLDQDILLEFYLQLLSKRLLQNRTCGLHVEEETISRMKAVFGLRFVSKIVALVTNYRLVATDASNRMDCGGVELEVMPLKVSSWPSFLLFADVILPPAMAACAQRFTTFYIAKNPMHKLAWIGSQGFATLRVEFDSGWNNLVVTTLQAVALLVLDQHGSVLVSELADMAGLTLDTVKRVLGSLFLVKGAPRILKKTPDTARIEGCHSICVDYSLKHPQREFNLPIPSLEEKRAVKEVVAEDRAFSIDASIVRIMKSRREPMPHHELVAEVLRQLQIFKPSERLIKIRIAELLSMEYIQRERPEEHGSPYVYCP